MPAPATADELLDLIQRSGVADEAKLRAYLNKLTAASGVPTEPQKLAGLLVRDGLLTMFQAEQLLQGKYKRFTIGKYKVLEKLGAGGMAQVFLCEHKLMRRRVAIKVLPTAKADDPSSLDRFYREARAVAAVDHPNIVRAYDIDQDENLHFLVMEYVDGTNLQDLVKKFAPLDPLRACHYIYGAAVGLQHAHEMGLVHRDIKPGNILLDRSGVVKILDMGLARFFHDEDDNLTRMNDENVLGTADYLAPEQALDSHTVDIRADIYSLGATFYFLLTGSAPFPEGSVAQKLIWHQNRPPRPIRSLRPEVPAEVIAVVEKMMAKKPEDRYQQPSDVMAALAGWVATPIAPPSEKEMPHVSAAAGGGNRGPATMIAPTAAPPAGVFARSSPSSVAGPGAPPTVAGGQTTATAPTPAPAADNASPHPAVWESLDNETEGAAKADTDRKDRRDRPSDSSLDRRRNSAEAPAGAGSAKKLLYAGAGLLALVAAAAGIYFGFIAKQGSGPDTGGTPGAARITVGEGENSVSTLKDALAKAAPGDTIVITKSRLLEPALRIDRLRHKDLTIEGATADGKPPLIEFGGGTGAMLSADSVEGLKLKNLDLDGGARAEAGVQVVSVCPGLTIEGVSVQRVRAAAFRLQLARGDGGRPIVLDRVRAVLGGPIQSGVLAYATGKNDTRLVVIRNSRFEGPGTGVRLEGAAADFEVTGNRFYGQDAALSFAKPPTGTVVKATVANNTVYQTQAGLLFDLSPQEPKTPPPGTFELAVRANYFAKVPEIGKATGANGPVPGVTATDNAHGPEAGAGNVPLNAGPLPNPQLPAPDPNTDATFLRFPAGPPEFGPNKVKVGAP